MYPLNQLVALLYEQGLWFNYVVDAINAVMYYLAIISDTTNDFLPGYNKDSLNSFLKKGGGGGGGGGGSFILFTLSKVHVECTDITRLLFAYLSLQQAEIKGQHSAHLTETTCELYILLMPIDTAETPARFWLPVATHIVSITENQNRTHDA